MAADKYATKVPRSPSSAPTQMILNTAIGQPGQPGRRQGRLPAWSPKRAPPQVWSPKAVPPMPREGRPQAWPLKAVRQSQGAPPTLPASLAIEGAPPKSPRQPGRKEVYRQGRSPV